MKFALVTSFSLYLKHPPLLLARIQFSVCTRQTNVKIYGVKDNIILGSIFVEVSYCVK